jgi:general stress protein 26
MFTTVGEDNYLVSRPLSTQAAEFDGERLWFFTSARSPKVREIAQHPQVNVAYASKDRNVYASVAGVARLNTDPERVDQFWSDAYKAYFPGGKDDPDVALIEVEVHTVEYWDGPGPGSASRSPSHRAGHAQRRCPGGEQDDPDAQGRAAQAGRFEVALTQIP